MGEEILLKTQMELFEAKIKISLFERLLEIEEKSGEKANIIRGLLENADG